MSAMSVEFNLVIVNPSTPIEPLSWRGGEVRLIPLKKLNVFPFKLSIVLQRHETAARMDADIYREMLTKHSRLSFSCLF